MQIVYSLWKVDLTHQMGYQAPSYFVETTYEVVSSKSKQINLEREELDALELAKQRSRLADFPDNWTITVTKQDRTYCPRRHKWLYNKRA
jgi:hypothetical protein